MLAFVANGWKRAAVITSILTVVVFYAWTVHTNGNSATTDSTHYFPLLAQAFLRGQTHLEIEPSPTLLALPNPYDPKQNREVRLNDASLFDGKYFLYFGPTPVVILFAPYQWITGSPLSQKIAIVFFCITGFFFSTALALRLIREHFPTTAGTLRVGVVLSLGMANICPFLLRRPDVYEVSISCAYAFLQASFYCLYRFWQGPRQPLRWVLATSICLGAAVGARWSYFLVSAVFVLLLSWAWQKKQLSSHRAVPVFSAALIPLICIGGALAIYNFCRFGNPLETGLRYQLGGNWVYDGVTSVSNVPGNFLTYLFGPPLRSWSFPFVKAGIFPGFIPHNSNFTIEGVMGMFIVAPVTVLILHFHRVTRESNAMQHPALRNTCLFIALAGAVEFVMVLFLNGTSMRYEVDFEPQFLFVACMVACVVCCEPQPKAIWFSRRWVLIVMMSIGWWMGLLLSFSGYYDYLREHQPATYARVARIFRPVEWVGENVFGAKIDPDWGKPLPVTDENFSPPTK